MDIDSLCQQLSAPTYRYRTGLLLARDVRPAALEDLAAVHRLELLDIARHLLHTLPAKTNFVGIGEHRILELLTECAHNVWERDIVLWANADIILAKLNAPQRDSVFRFLEVGLPKPATALVLALPTSASRLLPIPERRRWEQNERLVVI